MLIATFLGCILLFAIEFILYVREKELNKKHIKSKGLINICKEYIKSTVFMNGVKDFLIICLGATIALNCTAYVDNKDTENTVINLLEATKSDISVQYNMSSHFYEQYIEGIYSIDFVLANTKEQNKLIESILENDIIIITISPFSYSMLTSGVRNLETLYECLQIKNSSEEDYATVLLSINNTYEIIDFALDLEIKRLNGTYTDEYVEKMYEEYLNERFVKAEP